MKAYIYALIDPLYENILYIGKSCYPLQRYNHHCYFDSYPSIKLNWIKSLKKKNQLPILKILCKVNIKHWKEAERDFIRRFKYKKYILKNGSYGGDGMSFCTTETRKKLSQSRTGLKNHNFGKHLSKKTKQKISLSKIGKKHTEEHKRKIREGLLKSKKFKSIYTKERTEKINKTKREKKCKWKPISQFDLNGNFINHYESITKASQLTKITLGNIGSVLTKKRKSAGNFIWRYKNES